MDVQTCRLCSALSTESGLNIFSETGIEMKMADILSEHFKCDITPEDPLPNIVCLLCWETTQSFHELYKTSKEVQQEYLNSLVKSEPDPIDIDVPTTNDEIVEDIGAVELDQNAGKVE